MRAGYDAEGNVVGIEVLWASRLPGAAPMAMAFEVVNADRGGLAATDGPAAPRAAE